MPSVNPHYQTSESFEDVSSLGGMNSTIHDPNAGFYWLGKKRFEAQLADFVWEKRGLGDSTDRLEAHVEKIMVQFPYKEELAKLSRIWPGTDGADYEASCISVSHAYFTSLGSILASEEREHGGLLKQLFAVFQRCPERRGDKPPEYNERVYTPVSPKPHIKPERYSQRLNEWRGLAGMAAHRDCGRDPHSDLWIAEWSYGGKSWQALGASKPQAKHEAARLTCETLGLDVSA